MNNKKAVVALLLVATIGIVGLTIAYFANSTDVDNTFITKEYGTTYEETFVSPDNWLPGDTTAKTLVATNTGSVDQAVRILVTESWTTNNNGTLNGWIHSDGTKSNHTTGSELETDERVAILNLANTSDWTKVGNYYYYNYKLAPTESTSSLLESVTFNSKTKLDDTCTTTTNNGVTTTTCNSSGDDYDNATYTLTLTIETVQYNKYASAWNTGNTVNILEEKLTGSQYLIDNATNSANTEYNATTKGNMFVFSHEATSQTPAQTDYRYIGDAPNNYVKFNCDNDGTNCENWRILGVFDVDDGNGNVEPRIKLVRGTAFSSSNLWDNNADGAYKNDWTISSEKIFLNGDYYNRTGNASTYGLKESAREMITDAVFYLGAVNYIDFNSGFGTVEKIYIEERGNSLCFDCNNDSSKLTWTGKVAFMYPSDEYMTYGKGVDNNCYNNPSNCYNAYSNPSTGWVYNSNIKEGQSSSSSIWFLSTETSGSNAIRAYNGRNPDFPTIDSGAAADRPVVYLKSSVEIDSGTGTELDPYKLK